MGEKIAEEKYKNGTRFKYCFDNVENCDESYAIKRCFKIRDGNNCVKQKKGCKFRKKGKRCCLMYKCQLESKREEDEDEISPEEKDSIRTNDNQSIKTETTMNIDKDSQESNSEMQDKTTVEIDKYKEDTESETEEDEKQKQKGISEERERDKTTTISGTNEDEEALENLFGGQMRLMMMKTVKARVWNMGQKKLLIQRKNLLIVIPMIMKKIITKKIGYQKLKKEKQKGMNTSVRKILELKPLPYLKQINMMMTWMIFLMRNLRRKW